MRLILVAVVVVLLQSLAVNSQGSLNPCLPPACQTQLSGVPKNQIQLQVPVSPCTQPTGCPPQKPMLVAKVEKAPNPFCDCLLNPVCDCRKIDTVEPEIKEPQVFCGCLSSPGDCPCRPSNYHLIKDSCGCLHLQVCPCRMEYIEPETKEKHMEPELKDHSLSSPCGCLQEALCPCRVETITPEIKEPPCPCMDVQNALCACAGLRRN